MIGGILFYRSSEQSLEEQRKLQADLQNDVGTSKDRVKELQTELDNIVQQLGEAKIDKHEEARRKKKQEIVENFKKNFPTGVVNINISLILFRFSIFQSSKY